MLDKLINNFVFGLVDNFEMRWKKTGLTPKNQDLPDPVGYLDMFKDYPGRNITVIAYDYPGMGRIKDTQTSGIIKDISEEEQGKLVMNFEGGKVVELPAVGELKRIEKWQNVAGQNMVLTLGTCTQEEMANAEGRVAFDIMVTKEGEHHPKN